MTRTASRRTVHVLMLGCLASALPVAAQTTGPLRTLQTRAGTPIVNVASLRFDLDGATGTVRSNSDTIIVAEQLDIGLVRDGAGVVAVSPQPVAVRFVLTNNDNGEEAFAVTGAIAPGIATLDRIVVDRDGDGRYDPAIDTPLTDGRTPSLQPAEAVRLLAILTGTGSAGMAGDLTLTATSVTGSGSYGTSYPDAGDGGGDAVVGPTGAAATVVVPLRTVTAGPSLAKSQSVRAGDGSASAVRDAVITYTLEARFPDALPAARIDDPVPAGTAYVPGSLRLDGVGLTDAADGDAGGFDGRAIGVALAAIGAGTVHTIQFEAKIQ